jgi:hypothetical protein
VPRWLKPKPNPERQRLGYALSSRSERFPMSNHPFGQSDEPISGHAFPLLHNAVYCSRASAGIDDAAVAKIIGVSRRSNPEQGITGLLVFGSGIFFQWLEGPKDNVMQLMARITTDNRHQQVVHLVSGDEVRERMFPDWDMELVTGEDIRDVLMDALDNAKEPKNAEALRLLLTELDAGQLSSLGHD